MTFQCVTAATRATLTCGGFWDKLVRCLVVWEFVVYNFFCSRNLRRSASWNMHFCIQNGGSSRIPQRAHYDTRRSLSLGVLTSPSYDERVDTSGRKTDKKTYQIYSPPPYQPVMSPILLFSLRNAKKTTFRPDENAIPMTSIPPVTLDLQFVRHW